MKSLFYLFYLLTKQMTNTHGWMDKWRGSLMDGWKVTWQSDWCTCKCTDSGPKAGKNKWIEDGGGQADWWMNECINRWIVSLRAAWLGRCWQMFYFASASVWVRTDTAIVSHGYRECVHLYALMWAAFLCTHTSYILISSTCVFLICIRVCSGLKHGYIN